VAPEVAVLGGFEIAIGMPDGSVFHEDGAADRAFAFGVSVRGESTGPGDVAMTDRIERIAAFTENPTGAGVLRRCPAGFWGSASGQWRADSSEFTGVHRSSSE